MTTSASGLPQDEFPAAEVVLRRIPRDPDLAAIVEHDVDRSLARDRRSSHNPRRFQPRGVADRPLISLPRDARSADPSRRTDTTMRASISPSIDAGSVDQLPAWPVKTGMSHGGLHLPPEIGERTRLVERFSARNRGTLPRPTSTARSR